MAIRQVPVHVACDVPDGIALHMEDVDGIGVPSMSMAVSMKLSLPIHDLLKMLVSWQEHEARSIQHVPSPQAAEESHREATELCESANFGPVPLRNSPAYVAYKAQNGWERISAPRVVVLEDEMKLRAAAFQALPLPEHRARSYADFKEDPTSASVGPSVAEATADSAMCSPGPSAAPWLEVAGARSTTPEIRAGPVSSARRRPGLEHLRGGPGCWCPDPPYHHEVAEPSSTVDIKQVGNFLGEAFSLSHTIRLEFLNSVVLQNTGVVSALIQVFHMLQLPDDLQKINRLVHGVARIWWRQHERMQRESSGAVAPRKPPAMENGAVQLSLSQELNGLELKQYLSGSDVLHQLMFSTVMLHWYLYRDGPSGQKKDMDFDTWQRQNRGIETNGTNVPDHVQQQVYALVNKAFIPELAVASAQKKPEGGPDEGGGPGEVAPERPTAPLLAPFAAAEGWAQIVGGGFPKPSGAAGVQTVTYSHVSSIFSEVTQGTSGLVRSPLAASTTDVSKRTPTGVEAVPGTRMVKRDDFAWLSVVYTLLFFAAHPQTGAPYAFIELRKVSISQMDEGNQELTLVGVADPEDPDADFVAGGAAPSRRSRDRPGEPGSGSAPVGIVLLLPDGRWQEMSMPKLDLRFPSAESLKMWSNQIMAGSQGRTSRPSTGSVSALHRIQAT
ncbi:unnamed protein product [Symbiodinium sp. CCMP2456]|nr:unnamed protein product [Symbiodinium sp. CCMP2456]